mmetsp:Transcript_77522/g.153919  ORF Transcript_77522/g.153919 Transcript_77522/m.153919 type:complete len:470 (+) Transcript_77522:631-2040(+)
MLRAHITASAPARSATCAYHAGARAPPEPPWPAHVHTTWTPRNFKRTARQKLLNCLLLETLPVQRSNTHPKTTCSHSLHLTLLYMMLLFSPSNSNAAPQPVLGEKTHGIASLHLLLKTHIVEGPNILKNPTRALSLHLMNLTSLICLPHSDSNPLPSTEHTTHAPHAGDASHSTLSSHAYMQPHIHGSNARTMPKGNPSAPALGEDQKASQYTQSPIHNPREARQSEARTYTSEPCYTLMRPIKLAMNLACTTTKTHHMRTSTTTANATQRRKTRRRRYGDPHVRDGRRWSPARGHPDHASPAPSTRRGHPRQGKEARALGRQRVGLRLQARGTDNWHLGPRQGEWSPGRCSLSIYMYIYIYMCVCAYIYICIHTYTHIHTHHHLAARLATLLGPWLHHRRLSGAVFCVHPTARGLCSLSSALCGHHTAGSRQSIVRHREMVVHWNIVCCVLWLAVCMWRRRLYRDIPL